MAHQYTGGANLDTVKWADRVLVYDGVSLIEERTLSDGVLQDRYYYEDGLHRLALIQTGATEYVPLIDERGTVMGLTNTTGLVQEKLYYNSTGLMKAFDGLDVEKHAPSGLENIARSEFVPFGWTGMYKDRFTGLYHTHFREYDPVHGRWLSEDPAGYQDGLNLYAAYMGVNATDPLGTKSRRKQVLDDYRQYRRFIAEAPSGFEGDPIQWHLDEFGSLPVGVSGLPIWQIQAQHDAALLRDLQNRPIQRSGHDSFGHTAQHLLLDVAGTLDPTPGQPIDAAHAAIRASHGETADAALTGASVALPFAGDVFKLFRWANEGVAVATSGRSATFGTDTFIGFSQAPMSLGGRSGGRISRQEIVDGLTGYTEQG